MTFSSAGNDLVRRLERGLYDFAKDVMRESLVECPISGPETYVPQIRTIQGRLVYLGDDPDMVGDNGTLRRSARVFAPVRELDRVKVEVGYGFGEEVNPAGRVAAEYAVPVHERHELRHEPPTKSGYLLDPLLANSTRMGDSLAAAAKEPVPSGAMGEVQGAELMGEA